MASETLDRNTKYVLRHLRFGWWSLLVFLSLGIALEAMHGFKVGWYVNVSNSTRRLMWTLAHTHGTLTSLVHIAFGVTLRAFPGGNWRLQRWASPCLVATSFLLPGGFFLGGVVIYAGDPGLGILLVPVGAGLFFFAVLVTALSMRVRREPSELGPSERGPGGGPDVTKSKKR